MVSWLPFLDQVAGIAERTGREHDYEVLMTRREGEERCHAALSGPIAALLSLAVGVALMAHLPHGRYAAMSATASIISLPTAPTLTPSLVLDLSTEAGADVTMLLAANDILYLVEKTSGEVRAFPLHGMDRAEQFSKVLRRREGDNGLIIGQPISLYHGGEPALCARRPRHALAV